MLELNMKFFFIKTQHYKSLTKTNKCAFKCSLQITKVTTIQYNINKINRIVKKKH